METTRQNNIDKFYDLLDRVIEKFPKQTLNNLNSIKLPEKGVYFFFENGETRDNKIDNRVVRVGTHAAVANSKTTLYKRLYNHKGSKDLTGNHRSSVFRKLIGFSIANKNKLDFKYWGDKSKKGDRMIKDTEKPLERLVSIYLCSMPFTVLDVPGPSSKNNDRALIEENSIALLSNYNKIPIDKCSTNWLGLFSKDEKVISSGLWNSNYVDQNYIDEQFFKTFEKYLTTMNKW
jgi:hypothetical protein